MIIYWLYLKYLLRHKWYVTQECFKRGIYWRGILHDISKFRPDEFIPYARYFYGTYPEDSLECDPDALTKERVKAEFDKAWLLHQKRNPHHWQWWILQNDQDGQYVLAMEPKYCIEMLCDWIGAGKAITGKDNLGEWYAANSDKMKLHHFTRYWVESQLRGLDTFGEDKR